jgi:hypothetical protein
MKFKTISFKKGIQNYQFQKKNASFKKGIQNYQFRQSDPATLIGVWVGRLTLRLLSQDTKAHLTVFLVTLWVF